MTTPPRRRPPRLRSLAAVCGTLAGIGGITHGIGEILQGSVAPGGIVFDSWAQGPIARNLGGEPAMTLVGNLAVTGVLTVVASLAVVAWSLFALDRRHAGAGLMLLSVVMLAVGGGFGPPILGMLAGLVAGAAHVSPVRWARRLAGRRGRLLAALWPGLFWVCVLNAGFLVVGSLVVGALSDLAMPDVFVGSLFLVVGSMPLTALAGIASQVRYAADAAPGVASRPPDERAVRGMSRSADHPPRRRSRT